jgi:hypothetical protein
MNKQSSPGLRLREIFSTLTGRDGRDDIARIEAAMTKLEGEKSSAQAELATLASERTERLLDDDDAALDRIDRRSEALHRVIERVSEAGLPELQRRLAAARAQIDEGAREALYSAAEDASKLAEKALRSYPALAKKIVCVIEAVAKADAAVAQANAALPTGKQALVYVEHAVRGWPREDDILVDQQDRMVWTRADEPNWIIQADLVDMIETEDGITGTLRVRYDGGGIKTWPVVKRRHRTTKQIRGRSAYLPNPLSLLVSLPALISGAPDIWEPYGNGMFTGDPDGSEILTKIAEMTEGWDRGAEDPRGPRPLPDLTRTIIQE